AGILPGTGGDLTYPNNPFGGTIYLDNLTVGAAPAYNYIYCTTIPAEVCQEVDSKYDDGVWNTGEIRGNAAFTAGASRSLCWKL
ncbi:MAG: hypothetical protein MUP74_02795, partial [Desulfobacterales bacterium]|nr:hypothetical protein [Desulfobacterales bacterium]